MTAESNHEQRVSRLVVQLQLLSEAPAQSLSPRIARTKSGSGDGPAGAQPDRKGGPSPDDSLLTYFLSRYEAATNDSARTAIVAECEIRLDQRLDPSSVRGAASLRTAGTEEQSKQRTAERDKRIAEEYPDLEPAEVAAIESEAYGFCSPGNVRKVRVVAGRDALTGRPEDRPDDQVDYARQLKAAGHSLSSIAMRIGKPKSTVQGWLAKPRAA